MSNTAIRRSRQSASLLLISLALLASSCSPVEFAPQPDAAKAADGAPVDGSNIITDDELPDGTDDSDPGQPSTPAQPPASGQPDPTASPVPSNPTTPPNMPPGNGSPMQPPGNGSPMQPPGNGSPMQPPGNGSPMQPPGNGSPMQPPGNGSPMQPPGNGSPMQPPGNGSPMQPPGNGNPMQPPGNGNPMQPPGNGSPMQPPGNGNPMQPPVTGSPMTPVPVDSDPRAPKCVIDGSTLASHDAGTLRLGNLTVKKDHIPRFEGVYDSVVLEAKTIAHIEGVTRSLIAVADSIGSIKGVHHHVELAADTMGAIDMVGHDVCVSARSMSRLETNASYISLLGRVDGGQRAKIAHIEGVSPFVLVKDFDVTKITGVTSLKLVNSHVKSISGVGEIILDNTVVEKIDRDIRGGVVCIGNSKVLSHPDACRK